MNQTIHEAGSDQLIICRTKNGAGDSRRNNATVVKQAAKRSDRPGMGNRIMVAQREVRLSHDQV